MRSVLIFALTVAFCLCGVGMSSAIEITSMNPSDGGTVKVDTSSGYTNHNASITTSEAFSVVEWKVDGVVKRTTHGDGNQETSYFCPDPVSGSLNGEKYTIDVVAKVLNDAGDVVESASASYTLQVFSPRITFGDANRLHKNVTGHVTISRFYYETPDVMSDGHVHLYNGEPLKYPNGNNGKTYHYDGEARLEVLDTTIPDTKSTFFGALKPRESLNIPYLFLSRNLNRDPKTKGKRLTAQATYTIRVNDGDANRTDTRTLDIFYDFKHIIPPE